MHYGSCQDPVSHIVSACTRELGQEAVRKAKREAKKKKEEDRQKAAEKGNHPESDGSGRDMDIDVTGPIT